VQTHTTDPDPARQQANADAWWSYAYRLADWFLALVNRTDVRGGYRRTPEGIRAVTRHIAADRHALLVHIAAEGPEDIVGLHVTAEDETCRWVVIDVDAHGDGADPGANFRFALHVYERARSLGLAALLIDSNGAGGYHIWILFGRRVPAAVAWRLAKNLVRDFADFGLAKAVETFPKSPAHSGKRIGGFVRLPGLHHKRPHRSRVWGDGRWLEGGDAAAALLATTGSPVDPASVIPADFEPRPRRAAAARPARRRPARADDGLLPVPSPREATPQPSRRDVAQARSALAHLGAAYRDDYDAWLRVGMALRPLGDAGLALWHEWSSSSPKYEPDALDAKWEGFSAGGGPGQIGLGSLFHWARAAGWIPPRPGRRRAGRPARITLHLETTGARSS
jgi:hypothetical protein